MIEAGDVPCTVFSGRYDGFMFTTPSVYTKIHIKVINTHILAEGIMFEYRAEPMQFPGSHCHEFAQINDAGIHVYKPCPTQSLAQPKP